MSDTSPERVAAVLDDLRMERAFGRAATGPVCSDAIALIEALAAERDALAERLARVEAAAFDARPMNAIERGSNVRAALNETGDADE